MLDEFQSLLASYVDVLGEIAAGVATRPPGGGGGTLSLYCAEPATDSDAPELPEMAAAVALLASNPNPNPNPIPIPNPNPNPRLRPSAPAHLRCTQPSLGGRWGRGR